MHGTEYDEVGFMLNSFKTLWLAIPSEIQRLKPFEAYLVIAGHNRTKIRIPKHFLKRRHPAIIERARPMEEPESEPEDDERTEPELAPNPVHGHASRKTGKTAEYRAWDNAIQRCTNKNHPDYKDYGARGITFYHDWLGP